MAAADTVRLAVRGSLADLPPGSLVAVAVSGGRDSLALLLAALAVAPALSLRVGALTVDHGWHEGSQAVAAGVARLAREAGADPVAVLTAGEPTAGAGPEAGARASRYEVLDSAAQRWAVQTVLLGHTLDDQAETVLIRLSRGSGARSLSGMAEVRDRYRRPLLGLRRHQVHAALPGLVAAVVPAGLPVGLPWEDPANADPAMLRPRVRHELLPVLQRVLGPGAVEGLARTAERLRHDADALDGWAASAAAEPDALDIVVLAALPVAVRTRVLRLAAHAAGAGALNSAHAAALAKLAAAASGSGAGPIRLPGGVWARRTRGRLTFGPAALAPVEDEER